MSQSDMFDLDKRWPDLFDRLDPAQRRSVVQTLASSWLEGDRPDREDVKDFVDLSCGAISEEEYSRRSLEKARRIEAKNKAEKLS